MPCWSKSRGPWQCRDGAVGPRSGGAAEPGDAAGIAVPAAWRGRARPVCACPGCWGCLGHRGFQHGGTARPGAPMGTHGESRRCEAWRVPSFLPTRAPRGCVAPSRLVITVIFLFSAFLIHAHKKELFLFSLYNPPTLLTAA